MPKQKERQRQKAQDCVYKIVYQNFAHIQFERSIDIDHVIVEKTNRTFDTYEYRYDNDDYYFAYFLQFIVSFVLITAIVTIQR